MRKFLLSFGMIFCSLLLANCATQNTPKEVIDPAPSERTPAAAVENGEYLGVAQINGKLLLKSEGKLVDFTQGPVSVDLKSPNLVLNPLNFIRGDRVVVIKTQNNEFKFKIPKELVFENGKVSVHQKSAEQTAHLTIEENLKLVDTYEENGTRSCYYTGFCLTCNLGFDGKTNCEPKMSAMCSGSEKVLNKIELFDRNLVLKIYNDEGSARIGTSNKREIKKTFLKRLSSCG